MEIYQLQKLNSLGYLWGIIKKSAILFHGAPQEA